MTRIIGCAAVMLLMATASFAGTPDEQSARQFLEKVYAHYPLGEGSMAFDPTDKNAAEVFDPGLVAMFAEDRRLAKDEVGFVDADPLCQCQDDEGIKVRIGAIAVTGADKATAHVDLRFTGTERSALTIQLVVVQGQWRIYDLADKDTRSYRADFAKANKEHAAGHW